MSDIKGRTKPIEKIIMSGSLTVKKCAKCGDPLESSHRLTKYCGTCKINVKAERREQRAALRKEAKTKKVE